jgi:hypothetical protein
MANSKLGWDLLWKDKIFKPDLEKFMENEPIFGFDGELLRTAKDVVEYLISRGSIVRTPILTK